MLREIKSLQHPLIKHLVKLRQNHDYRYEHQSVVVEGIKPVLELCKKEKPKILVSSHPDLIPNGLNDEDIVLVNETVMQKISGMLSQEGLIAEFAMPKEDTLKGLKSILVLDGVSEPGNVGNLLRSALALGWEGIYFLDNCCDPYNDKALRAARGATFRLPIGMGSWKKLNQIIQDNQLTPYVADTTGIPPNEVKKTNGILLVLGNEAHGPSAEALSVCKKVTIPMTGEMESLNVSVAGGILMYLLNKN